jgi:transposase
MTERLMNDKSFLAGHYVGIDVSKDWLDIATVNAQAEAGQWRIDNTPEAIAAFIAEHWAEEPPALVAFEPTGGYERMLRQALVEARLPFARVNLNEVSAYRARRGIRAKTDAMDARLIADFAARELSLRGLAPMIEKDPELNALSIRRRQLIDLLHAERCRQQTIDSPKVLASLKAVAAALQASLEAIDAEIAAHIAAHPDLARTATLLRSLKGVGPVTVHTLIGELPELGQRDGKEIAALVGLAPHDCQSGKSTGRARTGHGRPGVRRVLFNVARSAIRHNPVLRAFYERLVTQNHRPGKVALTAVMRKVLVILNAIVRDQKPWQHA